MAHSVEFRRLRAGRPVAGDGVDFFGFTALSRGLQLITGADLAKRVETARTGLDMATGTDQDLAGTVS
jgi:hypothetical protein